MAGVKKEHQKPANLWDLLQAPTLEQESRLTASSLVPKSPAQPKPSLASLTVGRSFKEENDEDGGMDIDSILAAIQPESGEKEEKVTEKVQEPKRAPPPQPVTKQEEDSLEDDDDDEPMINKHHRPTAPASAPAAKRRKSSTTTTTTTTTTTITTSVASSSSVINSPIILLSSDSEQEPTPVRKTTKPKKKSPSEEGEITDSNSSRSRPTTKQKPEPRPTFKRPREVSPPPPPSLKSKTTANADTSAKPKPKPKPERGPSVPVVAEGSESKKPLDFTQIKIKKRPSNRPPVVVPKTPEESSNPYAKVKRPRKTGEPYDEEHHYTRAPSPDHDTKLTRTQQYALADVGELVTASLSHHYLSPGHISALRTAVQKAPFLATSLRYRSKVTTPFQELVAKGPKLKVPSDILLDAQSLLSRWLADDLSPDLSRGIIKTQRFKPIIHPTTGRSSGRKKVTSSSLDPAFRWRREATRAGDNGLRVGEWWPLQICCLRDGAHGSIEAGIHGNAQGAVSVILSGGHKAPSLAYEDVDDLDTVLYCGTRGERNPDGAGGSGSGSGSGSGTGVASASTELMVKAMRNKQAVRLIRSAKARSEYSPTMGFRYDGLYDVVEREWLDREWAMMRFRLVRRRGQTGIRWRGEEVRPTQMEMDVWKKDAEMWKGAD